MQIRDFLSKNLNHSLLSDRSKIQSRFDRPAGYLLKHCLLSIDEER